MAAIKQQTKLFLQQNWLKDTERRDRKEEEEKKKMKMAERPKYSSDEFIKVSGYTIK